MKSIIEQASSIMKAIEKAWNQAEQPKEFSIKIFEKEERNFFGMSVKPAKVGIFFGDKPATHEKAPIKPRAEIRECRPEARDHKVRAKTENTIKPAQDKVDERQLNKTKPASFAAKQSSLNKPVTHKPENKSKELLRPYAHKEHKNDAVTEKAPRSVATWNETMITSTHNWIRQILSLTNMTRVDFNSEVLGKNLKLTFNAPLAIDPFQEKQLFRSFAHLIMSSLRNQYKQEIKDLKVILTRPE
jgi:predicted RNA-binding protein Jag